MDKNWQNANKVCLKPSTTLNKMSGQITDSSYWRKNNLYVNSSVIERGAAKLASISPQELKDSHTFIPLSPQEATRFFTLMDEKRKEGNVPFFYKIGDICVDDRHDPIITEGQLPRTFFIRRSSTANQIACYVKGGGKWRFPLYRGPSGEVYVKSEKAEENESLLYKDLKKLSLDDCTEVGYYSIKQFASFFKMKVNANEFNFSRFDEIRALQKIKEEYERISETGSLTSKNIQDFEKNEAFHHKCTTRKEANDLLADTPIGTFLIRYSSTAKESFVLSLVGKDNQIEHYIIKVSNDRIFVDADFSSGSHSLLQEDMLLFFKNPQEEELQFTNRGFLDHLYRLGIITAPFTEIPFRYVEETNFRYDLKAFYQMKETLKVNWTFCSSSLLAYYTELASFYKDDEDLTEVQKLRKTLDDLDSQLKQDFSEICKKDFTIDDMEESSLSWLTQKFLEDEVQRLSKNLRPRQAKSDAINAMQVFFLENQKKNSS